MNEPAPELASFEKALSDLENVVHMLEDGETGLEQALTHYEKGVALLKQCYAQLRQAELRIQQLTGESADGQPVTQRFEHAATENRLQLRAKP